MYKLVQIPFHFLLILFSTSSLTQAEAIRVGWSGPLSGPSAVLGIDGVEAVRMAIREVNAAGGIQGRTVELLVEDDRYETTKAVSAYNKLVTRDKVVAVLMPTYGGVFATSRRAVQDGVLVINPLDCNERIAALDENTFCIATQSESISRAIGRDILEKRFSSIGVIYDESNPFMVLVEQVLRTTLGRAKNSRFLSFGVQTDTSDFKSMLLRQKSQGVDALVFLGHDSMGLAMAQARHIGCSAQFYTVGTITSPGYQQLAGEAAEGALVAYWEAPESPQLERFHSLFKEKTGRPPILDLATTPSYDATKLLLEAIRQSIEPDGTITVEKVRKALLRVEKYQGLSGTLTIDPDGAVRSIQEKIYQYKDGRLS